jgi:hypothetical protein|nr:MAG TPA: hypothetical protein [Caudoviricetes sp.]
MFILSSALSFVLGCTLVLLWRWYRIILTSIRSGFATRDRNRRRLEAIRAIRNDDSLTPREKFENSFRY